MFRTVFPSIIRSSRLFVQSWTPDNGRKDRPKHVEWYSVNSKIVHLVGCTIEIYHNARSHERQICHCYYRGQHWCLCRAISMLPCWLPVSCVSFRYLTAILVTHRQILHICVMKGTLTCSVMLLHQCCVSSVSCVCVYCSTAWHLWQLTAV